MDPQTIKKAQKALPFMWKVSRIGKTLETLPEIAEPGEQLELVVPTQTWTDDPDEHGTAYMVVATDRRVVVMRAGLSGAKEVHTAPYADVAVERAGKKQDQLKLALPDLRLHVTAPKDRMGELVELVEARAAA